MRFCWKYVDLQRVHLHYTHYLKEINRAISIFEHFLLRRQCLKARRYTNLKVSSPSIKGRNSRVYEKAAALLSVENAGCCKIKSYLQQPLSFLEGQSVECRALLFRLKRSRLVQKAWFLCTANRSAQVLLFSEGYFRLFSVQTELFRIVRQQADCTVFGYWMLLRG